MTQRFVPYQPATARPLCDLCGRLTRRVAVFYDRSRKRGLCARDAVLAHTFPRDGSHG